MKAKTSEPQEVVIQAIDRQQVVIEVEGVEGSSLITHRLSAETMEKVMSKETGSVKKKEFRNFDNEYKSCFYYTPEGKYGIPAAAFMGSMLDAAVASNVPKTQVKRAVRMLGDILELDVAKKNVNRRVDYPRRAGLNGAPDERHRPEFHDWKCKLFIEYDGNQITLNQIVNLINQAGFSSGVGDWRPSSPKSSGNHGMFRVSEKKAKKEKAKKE